MHQFGFANVVSPMGTSLTKEQIVLLKRYADDVVLIFDGDEAGKKAALRSLDLFLELNFLPKVIFLPEGADPDSILSEKGKEDFLKLEEKKEDLLLYIARRNNKLSKSFNDKVKSINFIKNKIMNIKNIYLKEYYLKEISLIYGIDYETLKQDIDSKLTLDLRKKQNNKFGVEFICEEKFLASLFYLDVDVVYSLIDDVTPECFLDKKNSLIFKKVVEIILNSGNIHTLLNDSEIGESVSNMLANYLEPTDVYAEAIENKFKLIFNYLDKLKQNKLKELSSNPANVENITKEINSIVKKQMEIKKNLLEE
jgi:DNA primase